MKKAVSIAILTAIILQTSCSSAPTQTTDTSGADITENETTQNDPNEDSLPDDLDFDDITIKVLFPESHGGKADQIDWVEEDDGDIVNSALYARRTKVEERLNVKFDVDYSLGVNAWSDPFKNSILADDKAWDVV